jgi:hypothetical protein
MKTKIYTLAILGTLMSLSAHSASTLFIGDSHSAGTFGEALDSKLRTLPDMKVRSVGSCGSIIHWWYTGTPTPCGYRSVEQNGKVTTSLKAPTPLVKDLIKENSPDLIIVEFGTNYVKGYPDETLIHDVKRLLGDIDQTHAKCLWVGPPDSRKYRTSLPPLSDRLEKLISGQCQWVNSREYTHYPETGGDGVHYETTALHPIARAWAEAVFKIVQSL